MPMEKAVAGADREREEGTRAMNENEAKSLREILARIWSRWCWGQIFGSDSFEFGGFGGKDEKAVAVEEGIEIRPCPVGVILDAFRLRNLRRHGDWFCLFVKIAVYYVHVSITCFNF